MLSTATDLDTLRYPIGRYDFAAPVSDAQLDTPYRPDGWTVRQLVHHVADSHTNGYLRCKWALTEDEPEIKPYDQERWSELADAALGVQVSLALLEAVHRRWDRLWTSLDAERFARAFRHPEYGRLTLQKTADWYAWHARHHVAHVTGLRARSGW